jgi:hypothetical protein
MVVTFADEAPLAGDLVVTKPSTQAPNGKSDVTMQEVRLARMFFDQA